jgi:ParB-like chromosome segregation protein Spo0J
MMEMRMQNIALDDIVPNPWRDMKLYPLDKDHVGELRKSINDHGFFGGVKGRRRNGKVELGCGHSRIEAARKAKLDNVQIFIDDIDDDGMLRLMTDENATQAGSNPGAVINEVAAVTRRLIEGLLADGTIVPPVVKAAFEDRGALDRAKGKLRNGADVHLAIGHNVIARYLGQGDIKKSLRGERQIREAITTLKQSGAYDEMVEDAISKYPPPTDAKPSKGRAVATTKPKPKPRAPVLDARVANVFPNENQFHAFREAVTTDGAKRVIPVENQFALAKQIMKTAKADGDEDFTKKHIGAPYIRKLVQTEVEQGMKAQREINKDEREAYLREQREERIESELHSANASLRSLLSALGRVAELADEFPAHPKIGGFAARLETLVAAITQFSKKLK